MLVGVGAAEAVAAAGRSTAKPTALFCCEMRRSCWVIRAGGGALFIGAAAASPASLADAEEGACHS